MDKNRKVKTRRLECAACIFRGLALFCTGFAVLGFFALVLFPQELFPQDARLIFIGGGAVAIGFLVGLLYPPWSEVEAWLGRVELLLRWQVASGVVIAFSAALAVRSDLMLALAISGMLLMLSTIPFAALSIIALQLRRQYDIRDHTAAENARLKEMDELKNLIAERRRPLIAWPRKRRKTDMMQDPTQQQ